MSRLKVKVIPKSSESRVAGIGPGGELRVKVHSAPEGGNANREMQRVLAEFFGCAPTACVVVRGESSRNKLVDMAALNDSIIKEKLQCLT
jgi:uncharacterized protein